jgi:hypothetical protein
MKLATRSYDEINAIYQTASFMRDDIPDGAWDELKEVTIGTIECHGKRPYWSIDVKTEWAEEIAEILDSWGMGA